MSNKVTGLGATVTVDVSGGTGTDISNDVSDFSFATPRAVGEVTGVDKSAIERLPLLADFSVTMKGTFNPSLSHTVFDDICTTTVTRTVVLALNSTPAATLTAECLLTDYQVDRGNDGKLGWTVPGVLANGTAAAWS